MQEGDILTYGVCAGSVRFSPTVTLRNTPQGASLVIFSTAFICVPKQRMHGPDFVNQLDADVRVLAGDQQWTVDNLEEGNSCLV